MDTYVAMEAGKCTLAQEEEENMDFAKQSANFLRSRKNNSKNKIEQKYN